MKASLKFNLRPSSNDDYIYNEIIKRNLYQKHFAIEPTDTVLDIGAQVGMFTCLAASLGAMVHGYEMTKENYLIMQQHISMNGLGESAHPYNLAVTCDGRQVEYGHVVGQNLGGHSMYVKARSVKRVTRTADSVSIKRVLRTIQPDFVKMDCEGAEIELLQSILSYHPDRLVFEYHHFIHKSDQQYAELHEQLTDLYTNIAAPPPGSKIPKYFLVYAWNKP